MRVILTVYFTFLFFSCSQVKHVQINSNSFPNRYSLDKLPEDWKKPATLKAINDILPKAIRQLQNAQSCMNCSGEFTIIVQLDSLLILDQTAPNKPVLERDYWKNGQQVTCTFRFKSHLSIFDSLGREIAQLVVVDPNEDVYSITGDPLRHEKRSSLFSARKDYSATIGIPLIPSDNELLTFTKQKLKVIQRRIQLLD